jgi:hypothetical protein
MGTLCVGGGGGARVFITLVQCQQASATGGKAGTAQWGGVHVRGGGGGVAGMVIQEGQETFSLLVSWREADWK